MCKKANKCVIAIDMGGTNIKYGIVAENFRLLHSDSTPACSNESTEFILSTLADVINREKSVVDTLGLEFSGIAVSTPGPFDYAAAKSHMQGKYDAIYDIDLRAVFRERCGLDERLPIEFMQDAAAFLYGELCAGNAKGLTNCACVTLGTGVGYACMLEGTMLLNERGGPYFVLAFADFNGTRVEDLIAGRAIVRRFGMDAKEISIRAENGDEQAIKIYYELGFTLGCALKTIPEIKKVSHIIIGGQISRSFKLLETGIIDGLGELSVALKLLPAASPDNSALFGAASMLL